MTSHQWVNGQVWRVARSGGPTPPGRIAIALRHFLAAGGSVGADADSAARRGQAGSRSGPFASRLPALPSPTQRGWVPGLGRRTRHT